MIIIKSFRLSARLCSWSTYLCISGKALDESFLPVDLLKDDQTLPSFAFVVRGLLVVALKE